jgi:acetylornithine deacetylase/succinyl-diaminopimelate desuccinylase-like protein
VKVSHRDAALEVLEQRFDETLDALCTLTRIPSVSAPGFDPAEVERSAAEVARLLEAAGLERVDVLRVAEDEHPSVVAEWNGAGPEAPTALLYAHHDVQPPGRLDRWDSAPFEPTLRPNGRIYGRGIVDDKAGVLVHVAAIRAWLESAGSLPINVRVLIEGEEEIGSPSLERFLRAHRDRLEADVLVLTDTANLDTGLPALTRSLRGLVNVDVTVRALAHPVHSGMWGGAIPDAASALVRLLSRLVDENGIPAVPGLFDDVDEVDPLPVPFDEKAFRKTAGLVPGANLIGEPDHPVRERIWSRPSIAVTALEAIPLGQSANQLISEAKARVGVRIAPSQDPERVCELLVEFLRKDPPWGVEVETEVRAVARGWRTETRGPAFEAARRALRAGYGRDAVEVGCGGTIPFVGPITDVLKGAPALLLGLEDPVCNAHGENESLHLGDFRSLARAAVHLLDELRSVSRSVRSGNG